MGPDSQNRSTDMIDKKKGTGQRKTQIKLFVHEISVTLCFRNENFPTLKGQLISAISELIKMIGMVDVSVIFI